MSFIIGITDGDNVARLASDGRITENGVVVGEEYKKIKTLIGNTPISVAFAGNISFADIIFKSLDSIPIHKRWLMTIDNYASEIYRISEAIYKISKFDRKEMNCFFILMGQTNYIGIENLKYKMIYVNTFTGEVQNIELIKGKVRYVCGNSGMFENQTYDEIVNECLTSFPMYTIDQKLKEIIYKVSKIDSTVNSNVFIKDI